MSLKNKYVKLTQAKPSTGDPEILPETLEAFEIADMIRDKAELTTTDVIVEVPTEEEVDSNEDDEADNEVNRAAVLSNIASAPASANAASASATANAAIYASLKQDRIRSMKPAASTGTFDLNQLIAQQMMQRENDREDDRRRREEDNRRRDEDNRRRDEDNRRREDENRSTMHQLMMLISGGAVGGAQPTLSTIAPSSHLHQLEAARQPSGELEDSASVTSTQTPTTTTTTQPQRRRSPRHKY
jgi:hypothetical protein